MEKINNFRLTFKYVLVSLIAVFATFFLHELSHWVAGELLGYHMRMTLNSAFLSVGNYSTGWNEMVIDAAGPVFTLLQAAVVYVLIRKNRNVYLYPFLFTAFYMRVLAGAMNFVNLNDEGRISKSLGLETFTISILVCAFLFILLYRVSKANGYRGRFQLINVLLTMLFSSALILSDQFLHVRII